MHDAVDTLSHKSKDYQFFLANNRAFTSKIDTEIANDAADEAAALAEQKDSRSAAQKLVAEAKALEDAIKGTTDEQLKQKLRASLVDNQQKSVLAGLRVVQADEHRAQIDNSIDEHVADRNNRLQAKFGVNQKQYVKAEQHAQQTLTRITSAEIEDPDWRELFQINNATLSMQLDLDNTEMNNHDLLGAVAWPLNLGVLTLNYSGNDDRTREAHRKLTTVSLFREVTDSSLLDCSEFPTDPEDKRARVYPIVGHIGIGELITQYFAISAETQVSADKYLDELTFTTDFKGGLNPVIELKPVNPSLVKADLNVKAERKDVHTLTVQIKPYAPPTVAEFKVQTDKKAATTTSVSVTENVVQ